MHFDLGSCSDNKQNKCKKKTLPFEKYNVNLMEWMILI